MKQKKHKCKICGAEYIKSNSFQKWCSTECAFEISKDKLKKQRQKKIAEDRVRIKAEKEKMKTPRMLIKELQPLLNRLIRIIDKDRPCIARPTDNVKNYDAGHYYSTGSVPSLRFWAHNIHKQSTQSNRDKSGDPLLFREGLINRYGEDYVKELEQVRIKYNGLKWTNEQLNHAKSECRKMIKESDYKEITRDEINKRLNLYT